MMFFDLYKIMVNKVTFVGFRGGDRPNRPLDPPMPSNIFFRCGWFGNLLVKKQT